MIFLFLLNLSGADIFAQGNSNVNESKREEIQRYFGYEAPLTGYLTLPMDISLNTNERGFFADIGYLFLILVPILFLYKFRFENKPIGFGLMLLGLFIMVIYANTTFVLSDSFFKIGHGKISTFTETNNSFLEDIYAQLLIGLNIIGSKLGSAINSISSESDYVSYPILLSLLALVGFSISKIKTENKKTQLAEFILVFGFFWLILSSGIIWYGYLLLPLLLITITINTFKQTNRLLKYFVVLNLVLWTIVSVFSRVSFIGQTLNLNKELAGKSIVNHVILQRSLGTITTTQLYNQVHPGLLPAIEKINSNESGLILTLGTTLGYFTENNTNRVINNNQLRIINNLIERYGTKTQINKALKLANIKYLYVDLNTATLDRTPERSLTNKFNKLLNYLSNNNALQLMATDRKVQITENGSTKYTYNWFGNVVQRGSYAIFEVN